MNKDILFFLGLFFLFSSCKKEKYLCSHSIYYAMPCSVAFSGFTKQEIEQIIVYKYKANTNFTELIYTDTLNVTNPHLTGDTAYAVNDSIKGFVGFWNISEGVDYEINVVRLNKKYAITGISTGPSSKSRMQETPCSMGSYQASIQTVNNIHINNQLNFPFDALDKNYAYFVYIQN